MNNFDAKSFEAKYYEHFLKFNEILNTKDEKNTNLEETKDRFYNHIKSFIYTSKNFVISQYTINEINKFFPNVKKENLILNYLASDTKKYFKIEI